MNLKPRTVLVKTGGQLAPPSPRDLVMAWAVDRDTGEPRYILQLDAGHRGGKSNCKCPSCDLPLLAVNAAKTVYQKRPHFRHPEGAARERCVIIAARRALEAMFRKQNRIVLPRRQRSRNVEGLSGRYFDAWVERRSERVRLADCKFHDETTAILTLDDGRRLLVRLVGHGEVSELSGHEEFFAQIELNIEDPAIAMLSPEEIFARLELAWSDACWRQHWEDAALDREAEAKAREHAANALDWLDDTDAPDGLNPVERRETLLHREVKSILERERRIRLPGLEVEAKWRRADGFIDKRVWSLPETEIVLTSVRLEVPLIRAVPDVVVEWVAADGISRTMLIEVTVTNPITDERIGRISRFGWPVLEIDIGRMGGIVTREEFTHLVVGEMAPKSWAISHPERSAILLALPMRAFMAVTRPLLVALNSAANWCLRRVGVQPVDELAGGRNAETLRELVDHSAAAGALDHDRRDQLMTALELDTAALRTLVRPDAAIASVATQDTIDQIRAVARSTGHLRLVVRDSGQPVGVVHVRDTYAAGSSATAADLARPMLTLPADQPIYQALTTLRRQHGQFAMVHDGDTPIGLITMHDLIDRLFPSAGHRRSTSPAGTGSTRPKLRPIGG